MSLLPRTRPKPEAVLDGLTTAVVVLDERLHVVALNTATEGLLGISRSMVLGKALCESIPHFVPLKARLTDANARALSFIERELSLKRGSEPAVTVDCTVTPFGLARQAGLLVEMQALVAPSAYGTPRRAVVGWIGGQCDGRTRGEGPQKTAVRSG